MTSAGEALLKAAIGSPAEQMSSPRCGVCDRELTSAELDRADDLRHLPCTTWAVKVAQ